MSFRRLLGALDDNMEHKEQSILFQNRRGYSPYIQCEDCDWTAECNNCAVSLTYHQRDAELRCHYCGHKEQVPRTCPTCGSTKVKTIGFGTEKLEDQLQIFFPAIAGVAHGPGHDPRQKCLSANHSGI